MTKQKPVTAKRFYEAALSDAEASDFPTALDVEGVDEEIAVLRLRLRATLQARPEDAQIMSRSIDMLVKLLAMRYRLSKEDRGQLTEAMNEGLAAELAEFTRRPGDD